MIRKPANPVRRSVTLVIICLLMCRALVMGQFSEPIQQGVGLFSSGQKQWDGELLAQAFAVFEQAAQQDTESFAANYLEGLAAFYLVLFYQDENAELAATYRTTAIDALERSARLDSQFPEPYAMLAVLTGMQIADAPLTAIWRGRRASRYQDKALELGPENPRSFYLAGVSYYKAPAPFGSDEKALTNLLHAAELYQSEFSAERTDEMPPSAFTDWGYDHCLMFVGHVLRAQGKQAEANVYYEKAIAVNSGLRIHLVEFMEDRDEQ